jgi:hypothetical protein
LSKELGKVGRCCAFDVNVVGFDGMERRDLSKFYQESNLQRGEEENEEG